MTKITGFMSNYTESYHTQTKCNFKLQYVIVNLNVCSIKSLIFITVVNSNLHHFGKLNIKHTISKVDTSYYVCSGDFMGESVRKCQKVQNSKVCNNKTGRNCLQQYIS